MGAAPILKKHTIYELLNDFLYKDEHIPTSFLKNFIDATGASQNMAARLLGVATRTLQRELANPALSSELSDRFLHLIDLYKEGLETFYNLGTFKQWLDTSKSAFQGKKPFDLMHTITGIQQVKEEIMRTKLGILT